MPGSDKDLEKIIASIGVEEQAVAQKQIEIEKMKQLLEKLKKDVLDRDKKIKELEDKIKNMYDLPADIEELKRLIGEQRADLNAKDQQLEMAYGQIAQYEAELKNTRTQVDMIVKNMDVYVSQVGELKVKLMEKDSIVKMKDKELQEAKLKLNALTEQLNKIEKEFENKVGDLSKGNSDTISQITSLKTQIAERDAKLSVMENEFKNSEANLIKARQAQEQLRAELAAMHDKLREKQTDTDSLKNKIETELKDQILQTKTEAANLKVTLENQILEKDLKIKELTSQMETATKKANEVTSKAGEFMANYEKIMAEKNALEAQLKPLQDFFDKNQNTAMNLQLLTKLFEQEPLFKAFNITAKVGEINVDDLKAALGVPAVTTNKYVQMFVKIGLFELLPNGKIALKYKMKDFIFEK